MNIDDLQKSLDKFNTDYPRPNMPILTLSNEYDIRTDFDKPYPGADSPGVYAIFHINGELLRIGKSSCNSNISSRLSDYYKWGVKDSEGIHKHPGYQDAKIIRIISFPKNRAFEVPALEEFLIGDISLPYNTNGQKL